MRDAYNHPNFYTYVYRFDICFKNGIIYKYYYVYLDFKKTLWPFEFGTLSYQYLKKYLSVELTTQEGNYSIDGIKRWFIALFTE